MRITDYYAVIPNDVSPDVKRVNPHYNRQMQTLILLHGYTGRSSDWITGSGVRELSSKYNLAILMPDGSNSFYIDREETGAAYSTYVGQELLEHAKSLFRLSDKREDTFIGGYSMGGFGAIRNGLKYADTYSKIIGLSNALVTYMLSDLKKTKGNSLANLAYYEKIFGELDTAKYTDKNPEVLIKELLQKGMDIPRLFLACGTEDELLGVNRKFKEFLSANNVKHEYMEDTGMHDWTFWNKCLVPAFDWLTASDGVSKLDNHSAPADSSMTSTVGKKL